MKSIRFSVRLALFISALFVGASTPTAAVRTEAPDSVAAAPEARIRKLHLVRPDLIPYPLYYEVIC